MQFETMNNEFGYYSRINKKKKWLQIDPGIFYIQSVS